MTKTRSDFTDEQFMLEYSRRFSAVLTFYGPCDYDPGGWFVSLFRKSAGRTRYEYPLERFASAAAAESYTDGVFSRMRK